MDDHVYSLYSEQCLQTLLVSVEVHEYGSDQLLGMLLWTCTEGSTKMKTVRAYFLDFSVTKHVLPGRLYETQVKRSTNHTQIQSLVCKLRSPVWKDLSTFTISNVRARRHNFE